MDMTPIEPGIESLDIYQIGIAVIVFIVSSVLTFMFCRSIKEIPKIIIITVSLCIGIPAAACAAFLLGQINQHTQQARMESYVEAKGFEIVEGKPAIVTGEKSTMKIRKYDTSYSCTSYAPQDAAADITFICNSTGFGKISLDELEKQIEVQKANGENIEPDNENV